jgi:hypothetical protein
MPDIVSKELITWRERPCAESITDVDMAPLAALKVMYAVSPSPGRPSPVPRSRAKLIVAATTLEMTPQAKRSGAKAPVRFKDMTGKWTSREYS